ncbi:MAG TPA: short-chain dehydrogenase/reductase [Thermoleophilaceae bacterium]|nr:short-chain dehydrogenase/reductase [Thermoleophilaceae bacterium]
MPRYDLNGKVALVTGAARGIGFATAKELVARGASVVIVDLDQEACDTAAAEIHDSRAVGLAGDVTERTSMQRAVAVAVERFGSLDVVVANAGIAPRGATMRAMTTENFERTLDVNLNGVYRTVDAALPEIIRRRGHVVVIASVYAFVNGAGALPYAMSKAGVEQFGRGLRVELRRHGASASVAYFGFIDTEMVRRGIDADPIGERMKSVLPRALRKRVPPSVAGRAIVEGIEGRKPRIIRPRRWTAFSVMRGIINPLSDRGLERPGPVQETMEELDGRAGEEQPTTA